MDTGEPLFKNLLVGARSPESGDAAREVHGQCTAARHSKPRSLPSTGRVAADGAGAVVHPLEPGREPLELPLELLEKRLPPAGEEIH